MKSSLPVFLILGAALTASAEIIPTSRTITFDPGVRGGIPERTRIHVTLPTSTPAAGIQAALNACPSNAVVLLAPGTFRIGATLTIPSGVTLRGAGISNTVLEATAPFNGATLVQFNRGFDDSWSAPPQTISPAPAKSDARLTTTGPHGWTVGDVVLIDMQAKPDALPAIDNAGTLGSCSWCGREGGTRPIGQLVKVTGVPAPNTITFDPPLYWAYTNMPQGVQMRGLTHYAGVESLSINTQPVLVRDVSGLFGAVNCWFKDIEMRGIHRRAVWGYNALWFEMRGCLVHEARPESGDNSPAYTSDRAYGPFFGPHVTASLVTDCILQKLTLGMAWEGAALGNVLSYSFITNIWWQNTGDAPRRFGPLMHGPHPAFNLIEGNWSGGRIRADEYWGTSSHFIALRNRVVQVDRGRDDSQTWTIDIERRNHYWSFVGNVLGGGGGVFEENYELLDDDPAPYSSKVSSIWKLGYQSVGSRLSNYDSNVVETMIRWGNWCYRTNDDVAGPGQTWHTNGVGDLKDRAIPASYYLKEAPKSFGSLAWPPYDPTKPAVNSITNIPAGYRYAHGTNPPSAGTAKR